jgi:hypothetical protein
MSTTEPHKKSLSGTQQLVISALLSGKTDREAAMVAGVSRETVNRWRNHDPFFQAELNQRQQEIWESYKIGLQALIGDALQTISRAVRNNPTIAMKILEKCQGLNEIEPPAGPTDVDDILLGVARERAQEELTEIRRKEGTGQPLFSDHFEEALQLAPLIRKHYSALKEEYGVL